MDEQPFVQQPPLPARTLEELASLAQLKLPYITELHELFAREGVQPGEIRHRVHVGPPGQTQVIFDGMLDQPRAKFGKRKLFQKLLEPAYGARGRDFVIKWLETH